MHAMDLNWAAFKYHQSIAYILLVCLFVGSLGFVLNTNVAFIPGFRLIPIDYVLSVCKCKYRLFCHRHKNIYYYVVVYISYFISSYMCYLKLWCGDRDLLRYNQYTNVSS